MIPGDLLFVHDNFVSGDVPTVVGIYIGYRYGWAFPMHTVLTPTGMVERIESELELIQGYEKLKSDGVGYNGNERRNNKEV